MITPAKHLVLLSAAALLLIGVGCKDVPTDQILVPQTLGAASNIDPPGGPDGPPRRRLGETAPTVVIPREEVTVPMASVAGSGVSGDALFVSDGANRMRLFVRLDGTKNGEEHPVHVHLGSCADPGAIKYPVAPLKAGQSSSIVNGTITDILNETPLVIVVPKSIDDQATFIACGEIKRAGRKPLDENDRVRMQTPPKVVVGAK